MDLGRYVGDVEGNLDGQQQPDPERQIRELRRVAEERPGSRPPSPYAPGALAAAPVSPLRYPRVFLPGHFRPQASYLPPSIFSQIPRSYSPTRRDLVSPPVEQQRPFTRQERRRRQTAALVEPRMQWLERGYRLLKRTYCDAIYSVKVFIGGLPSDATPDSLMRVFQEFRPVKVIKTSIRDGHAYLILESDASVKALLSSCENLDSGEYYFPIGNRDVQVIPWALRDIEWGRENASPRANCIFVGGLHGETTAEHVKIIMEENFGQVQHVLIDTDRYSYPAGSARVQFVFSRSYILAINVNFLGIHTKHYSRTVQLEPFFEKNVMCSRCRQTISTYICRHYECLRYFCKFCFRRHQEEEAGLENLHRPIGLN